MAMSPFWKVGLSLHRLFRFLDQSIPHGPGVQQKSVRLVILLALLIELAPYAYGGSVIAGAVKRREAVFEFLDLRSQKVQFFFKLSHAGLGRPIFGIGFESFNECSLKVALHFDTS
jgi:hypothetical protein